MYIYLTFVLGHSCKTFEEATLDYFYVFWLVTVLYDYIFNDELTANFDLDLIFNRNLSIEAK